MFTDWMSSGLWRASWQGALCAALVWAVSRAWPRLPASLRAGLWWLVALKFVVALGWLPTLALPVLPASVASSVARVEAWWSGASAWRPVAGAKVTAFQAQGSTREGVEAGATQGAVSPPRWAANGVAPDGLQVAASTRREAARHGEVVSLVAAGPGPSSWMVGAGGLPVTAPREAGRQGDGGGAAHAEGEPGVSLSWGRALAWLLLMVWGAGVLWQMRGQVKSGLAVRRLRRAARPLVHPALEAEVRALSAAAGLRRAPMLLVSETVASPLATGLLSPVVVLPAEVVRLLPMAALRMALAHELAHLRRGDLWLGWVPALMESLFFFHPLARRAAREYALAREEACDAEAIRLTDAELADYGELILAFGIARAPGSAAALGASSHVDALHRRLSMLEHVDAVSPRIRRVLKVALSAMGVAALVPFQVVAREAGAASGQAPESPASAPAAAQASKPASSARPAAASPSAKPAPSPGTATASPAAKPAPSRGTAMASPAEKPAPSRGTATASQAAKPAPSPAQGERVTETRNERVVVKRGVVVFHPQGVASASPAMLSPTPPAAPTPPNTPAELGDASPLPPLPPTPPAPRIAVASHRHVLGAGPHLAAVPPPPPPAPPAPPMGDPDRGYVLLADGSAMMNGTTVDLELARTFKQKNKEILFVRRKDEAFIIRDPATLKAVREALSSTRELGKAQSALGEKQAALGKQQAALGQKQATLGHEQGGLGRKLGDLAYRQAGLHLEETRLDSLSETERERRRAELKKQDRTLEQEMAALEKQMAGLAEKQGALSKEQGQLSEKQHALHEEQVRLSEQHQARVREAEVKVHDLIDEALRKGLGQPLPT
ncbi:M56 family metallopeptidase [Corallococcus macrosporus]|uniref:Peptidase m56 family protein n=1 Tax=Myxococcus fulvus (strain ATCC BAA-855 / HW-1) TaxID=483219 RepID=F8C8V2_MYXFH|nr:M56 family metallopeptidase [Corallococcus macrosporus]AEI64452.1 peptidase m56 family protein [Corallococcus macrosporus]